MTNEKKQLVKLSQQKNGKKNTKSLLLILNIK